MRHDEHVEVQAQHELNPRERMVHRCNKNHLADRHQVRAFTADDDDARLFQHLGDDKVALLARRIAVEACIFQDGLNVESVPQRGQKAQLARRAHSH